MDTTWDCIVVGGGAAGLSAALVLGRARRSTLLVDAGEQSNRHAHGIGGLLGYDGRPPGELYATGREELASYRPPSLPGVAELWGRTVFHCPFCHGWEARDRPLAVLDNGDSGVHRALLLRNWSDDVVLLTDGAADFDASDRDRLAAAGITVDERAVTGLDERDGELTAIAFTDGDRLERRGLLVPAPLHQRSDLAEQLGAASAESGPVAVDPVGVDAKYATSADGVFAAGDLSAHMPQIAGAIAAGSMAAAMVVQSLVAEERALPVAPTPVAASAPPPAS